MKTVTRDHPDFDDCIEQIKEMVSNLPNDKLCNNYSFPRLKSQEWEAVSLFAGGFSSVIWRPYWQNNCRILNRFYKVPNYRFENRKARVSQETLQMIDQQLTVAKQLGFDCAFMSRETKKQAFNHYKKHLPQTWFTSNEKYLMTGNSYQHVMWTSINSNTFIMEKE